MRGGSGIDLRLSVFLFISGIVVAGYAPLGSPDRPYPNKEVEPILLNDPVLKKIADKHKTTVALVRVKLFDFFYEVNKSQVEG